MPAESELVRQYALNNLGAAAARVEALRGDASSRRYYRCLDAAGRKTTIACYDESGLDSRPPLLSAGGLSPENILEPAFWQEYNLKPVCYNRFLFWSVYLKQHGLPVPGIHLAGEKPVIIMEDAGQHDLSDFDDSSLDGAAVGLLKKLHAAAPPARAPFNYHTFTRRKIVSEMMFLLKNIKNKLSADSKKETGPVFFSFLQYIKPAVELMVSEGRNGVLTHRDFHSRNIMVKDGQLCLVDYQDMFISHPAYDLVSFTFDPYRNFRQNRTRLLKLYYPELDSRLEKTLFVFALQRLLKACGSYLFLSQKDARYLNSLPVALKNILELPLFFEQKPWQPVLTDLLELIKEAGGLTSRNETGGLSNRNGAGQGLSEPTTDSPREAE